MKYNLPLTPRLLDFIQHYQLSVTNDDPGVMLIQASYEDTVDAINMAARITTTLEFFNYEAFNITIEVIEESLGELSLEVAFRAQ